MLPHDGIYDVAIVGGGVSGTALAYALSKYTDIANIILLEKHEAVGTVNSKSNNNSQTLHVGDIETNYNEEKVRQVKGGASMVAEYAKKLPETERRHILFPVQKMVLGVGEAEVHQLHERFQWLKEIFPHMREVGRQELQEIEPKVVDGRDDSEPIGALVNDGYAVDYEILARSLAAHAKEEGGERTTLRMRSRVTAIHRAEDKTWVLRLEDHELVRATSVIFDADAYSLLFAKQLGYGHEYSLIPVAGTFFFSPELLRGKVYTVQNPRLPFSAVHGDPDVSVQNATRWGPTARFLPVLESRNYSSIVDYFRVSGLHRPATWLSFFIILLDPLRAWYLFRNVFFEIPYVGNYFFARQVQKIVPSARARDFKRARGFGGMRLQRVDTRSHELLLGEGKILGDKVIFNMTPSPGASVCLYNALRDSETIVGFFSGRFTFDKERMMKDLCSGTPMERLDDPSQRSSYVS